MCMHEKRFSGPCSTSALVFSTIMFRGKFRMQLVFTKLHMLYSYLKALIVSILFRQITTSIKVSMAFVFGLQILQLIDFSRIYQLKGLEPKNKGHTKFYECCALTKKVYLIHIVYIYYFFYFVFVHK